MNYKEHPIHKGYFLSPEGKVNGLRRKDIGSTRPDGYRWCHIVNIGKQQYIHRLMWETYKGEIPEGMEINHKDGDKSNNHINNLELCTHAENVQHRYKVLGHTMPSGKDHHNYGKQHSVTTKGKMSRAKLGCKHPKFKGWYVVDGVQYESTSQAAKAIGTYPKKIYDWCHKAKNGWYFLPK